MTLLNIVQAANNTDLNQVLLQVQVIVSANEASP